LGQEHVISILCHRFGLDYQKKHDREVISKSIGALYSFWTHEEYESGQKYPVDKLDHTFESDSDFELFRRIEESDLILSIYKDFQTLSNYRNSINHGGMIGDKQGKEFLDNSYSYYLKLYDKLKDVD
jgi:hypothetical protein